LFITLIALGRVWLGGSLVASFRWRRKTEDWQETAGLATSASLHRWALQTAVQTLTRGNKTVTRKQYRFTFLACVFTYAVTNAVSKKHADIGLDDIVSMIAWVALVAAVVMRAHTVGRRDWLWGFLAFVPFTALWLCGVREPEGLPPVKRDLWRTASITFVACASAMAVYVAAYIAFDIAVTTPKAATTATSSNDVAEPLAFSYDIIGDRIIIHAKGEIGEDQGEALNAWWGTLPPNAASHMRIGKITLALDSPGGSVRGASHFADWIKENKVDTIVPNGAWCASACVIVWGAGAHKSAGETARIGVHGARSMLATNDDRNVSDAAAGTLFVARALADERAPPAVVAAVATTTSDDLHWLTAEDVVDWGGVMLDKNGQPQ
jgi:ATP-dependent protease ClpP protease subunit